MDFSTARRIHASLNGRCKIEEMNMRSLQGILIMPGLSWFGAGMMTVFLLLSVAVSASPTRAQNVDSKKPAVVLVHGAFADGSSWSKVIALLQAKGCRVVAVRNPLTFLADDVAATNRAINQQTGAVVLVGRSWAGVVITEAENNSKIKSLCPTPETMIF
jgi:pimeloyl-ACP methyl ester carboxylesterase